MTINRRNLFVAGTSLAIAPVVSFSSAEASQTLQAQAWNDGWPDPMG